MAKIIWESEETLLRRSKKSKSDRMSKECEKIIYAGFDLDIQGQTYHFSYDSEAQLNFNDTSRLMDKNLIDTKSWTVTDADGVKKRIELTAEEFDLAFLTGVMHKDGCVDYLRNVLEEQIKQATSEEELAQITWQYNS